MRTNSWLRRLRGLDLIGAVNLALVNIIVLRSASDHSMDTTESKPGSSGATAAASATPQPASADTFKESDVANIVKMGFTREVSKFIRVHWITFVNIH